MSTNVQVVDERIPDHDSRYNMDSYDSESRDSTKKRKSFRRLVKRFAEKTSMQGVPYINNAKLWWAKLIWSVLLLGAVGVMGLHLWYLFDQYYGYPKLTKIELGFDNLDFPEITICNTNIIHSGRLNTFNRGVDELKELVDDLKPENLAPDQFDPNYDPEDPPDAVDPGTGANNPSPSGSGSTQAPTGNVPQSTQPSTGNVPQSTQPSTGNVPQSTQPSTGNVPQSIQPPTENVPQNFQPPTDRSQTDSPPPSTQPATKKRRRKRFVNNLNNLNTTKYMTNDRPPPLEPEDDEFDGERTTQTEVDELFTELYMDIDKVDRARLGHDIEDMLRSCSFNGRQCNADMFNLHQTAEYGNCYSLNSDQFIVKSSGPGGGLSLIFYLETSEYLDGITNGYGARLLIHRKNTYPTPADEGIFIAASMETSIGLRMTTIERLGGNYGTCETGESFQKLFGFIYTRSACQKFCFLSRLIETCGCFLDEAEEAALKGNSTLKPCRGTEELNCMQTLERQIKKKEVTCTCDTPCSEVQWSKTISQRQWPSDNYAKVLLQDVCEDHPTAVCKELRNNVNNSRVLNNNFLKLNIYYEELNFHNITETPEIETAQFASDVGGAVGLWIGLSILSICEVLQLLLELCDYGVNRTLGMGGERRDDRRRRRPNDHARSDDRNHHHHHHHHHRKHEPRVRDNDSDYKTSPLNGLRTPYKQSENQWPSTIFRPGAETPHSDIIHPRYHDDNRCRRHKRDH